MTEPQPQPDDGVPLLRTLVLDTNVYISAAISPDGVAADLLKRAGRGAIEIVTSEKLLDELDTRLQRDKFRQWLTLDEVDQYVDAVRLLTWQIKDRPDEELPLLCRDPDDNFLIALFDDSDAHMLVSGDRGVLAIKRANLFLYTPRAAQEALDFKHEWGTSFVPGEPESIRRQVEFEGSAKVIAAYSSFVTALKQPDAVTFLPYLVVPETLRVFQHDLTEVQEMLENRGMTSRPEYAAPDVAYIKLPPDCGENLRAAGVVVLPPGTIFATMVHCPDVEDVPGVDLGQWRVFGIGDRVPVEQIPRRSLAS